MLVCPQCQFENPNTNRFCQKCGNSLTHKACSHCGEQVAFSELQCHNCGTITGTLWLAIITAENPSPVAASTPQGSNPVTEPEAIASVTSSAPVVEETQPVNVTPPSESTESNPENEVSPTSGVDANQETAENLIPIEQSATPVPPESSPGLEPNEQDAPLQETSDREQTSATKPFSVGSYLDSQQRYQILEAAAIAPDNPAEVVVKVLDLQPLQLSPLVALSRQLSANTRSTDQETTAAQANWEMAIPAIARVYLTVQAEFLKVVPKIHDAWQQDHQTVLLLEDRSALPLLVEDWKRQDLPGEQILEWLSQLIDLWAALEPWCQRTSLLKIENLRVNEHRQLCLQRLYSEPADKVLTLRHLGQLWQELYTRSDRTQLGDILELQQDLFSAKIETLEQLRSRLDTIMQELPAKRPPNASSVTPETFKPGSTTRLQVDDTAPAVVDEDEDPTTLILPMQLMGLEAVGRTDVGRQRDRNEDDFAIETQILQQEDSRRQSISAKGLYILCDGMGGHAAGEVASASALKTLREYFHQHWSDQLPQENSIREAILLANQAIYDINQQETRSGSGRMGTTLVMALLHDHQVAVAHVGDSRLYCLSRRRGLKQVTVDHEVGQREIKRGVEAEIAYSRPDAYQLTQALGPRNEDFIHPDIQFFDLDEDMILLLASDGLTDNDLIETHWQTKLLPLLNGETSLERGIRDLIDLANEHNGHDNITAILIRVKVKPG